VIETVLGPIPADELGATSMHEHLLWDARALGLPDPDDRYVDDPALAAAELGHAGAAGQRAVVDLTVWGFGGPSPALPEVARASGVQIVAGVGAYLGRTQPEWLTALDVDGLTALFVDSLTDHLPGCDYRAGIVGLVGLGHPAEPAEERALRAAGAAAAATGRSVVARLDPRGRDGLALLAALEAEGLPADRVVLSNVDGYADAPDVLRELASTGATLKWSFGYEAPPRPGLLAATDAQRIEAVYSLRGARQVLAGSVWTRSALRAYGGWGYDHVLRSVVPKLRAAGVSDAEVDAMLVGEPRRLLDQLTIA
jgi:phosphotriesterase-related protein